MSVVITFLVDLTSSCDVMLVATETLENNICHILQGLQIKQLSTAEQSNRELY